MGSIKGKFIKGLVGPVVFREYRGMQIIQGLPKIQKSKRTAGTKNAAKAFGKASKLACGIRQGLSRICWKLHDGTMTYRLNTEVLRCLNAIKDPETQKFITESDSFCSLAGFEFHAGSLLKNYFHVQPSVNLAGTTLRVTLPDIKVPSALKWPINEPKACKLLIIVALIDLAKGRIRTGVEPQVMEIPHTFKPSVVPGQTFEFEVIPGCLCVTGISLLYTESTFIGESPINNKSFNPAAILHAQIAEGTTDPEFVKGWQTFDQDGY